MFHRLEKPLKIQKLNILNYHKKCIKEKKVACQQKVCGKVEIFKSIIQNKKKLTVFLKVKVTNVVFMR